MIETTCWNILPQSLRQAKSAKEFSNELKKMLLSSIKIDVEYVVNSHSINLLKRELRMCK